MLVPNSGTGLSAFSLSQMARACAFAPCLSGTLAVHPSVLQALLLEADMHLALPALHSYFYRFWSTFSLTGWAPMCQETAQCPRQMCALSWILPSWRDNRASTRATTIRVIRSACGAEVWRARTVYPGLSTSRCLGEVRRARKTAGGASDDWVIESSCKKNGIELFLKTMKNLWKVYVEKFHD